MKCFDFVGYWLNKQLKKRTRPDNKVGLLFLWDMPR